MNDILNETDPQSNGSKTARIRLIASDDLNTSYKLNTSDEFNSDRIRHSAELFTPKWSNTARISVFSLGLSSLILAIQAKGNLKKGLGLFGVSSILRAITNLHVTDIIGWVANPTVRLKRRIRVRAPIDDVYDFLSRFTNYPRFMSYIHKVEINDTGGLRWTARGPAGLFFHWNTTLKNMTRNQAISWKSSINSLVRNSGYIELIDLPGEGTEICIDLSYAPPVGALGYAAVHFLGFDPKDKIDEDLYVLKSLIEENFSSNLELIEFHRG